MEIAKIHAENAIRNKQNAISLERLGARLEAVGERIGSAAVAQRVSEQISRSVPLLHGALETMEKMGVRFLTSTNTLY